MIIKQVSNGYILKHEGVEYVFDDSLSELRAIADLLQTINQLIGPTTSRHSKERIVISIEPGDKYLDDDEDEECG